MDDLTNKNIDKKARQKIATVKKSEKKLIEIAAKQQRKLNNFLINTFMPSLDIKDGNIINNTNNLKKVNTAAALKRYLKNVINESLLKAYIEGYENINKNTASLYDLYEPTKATKERIFNRSDIMADGFLTELFDNNEIQKEIQGTLRDAIATETKTSELKNLLTQQIKGTEEKMGALESFHYSQGRDSFQAHTRGLDVQFAKALKLNYFIYQGGVIKTTRDFCDERNGGTFTREEVEEWQGLTWQGKKDGHNIFTDLGGYNCRHDLTPITYELAKRRRPDIEKSKYD